MALEAGTRLGPYEITSLLGKGGMGEVYAALGSDAAAAFLLVMEHLEGQTLAQRIAQGDLSLDEALRVGGEVPEALHCRRAFPPPPGNWR